MIHYLDDEAVAAVFKKKFPGSRGKWHFGDKVCPPSVRSAVMVMAFGG